MSIRASSRCIAFTFALVLAAASASVPATTLTFYNGAIASIGTDNTCLTGTLEILEQAYDGFTVRHAIYTPAVGEIWYAHVVISHPGNPCSGGSATGIEILPPANTAFAISADNPVFCALRNQGGQVTVYYRQNQGCPQAPSQGVEGYAFWAYSGSTAEPWIIATGTYLELMIPLRSTSVLNGSNLTFRINPDLGVVGYTSVGTYVNADVIFRSDMEDDLIEPDICTISGTTSCSLAP
jgi:hypothetical protein